MHLQLDGFQNETLTWEHFLVRFKLVSLSFYCCLLLRNVIEDYEECCDGWEGDDCHERK